MKYCFKYKINKTVNKFLLFGDKFMHEMNLKQHGFIYSAFGSFTKNKEIIEKLIKTRNTDFILFLITCLFLS